jgi:hypothetical protein
MATRERGTKAASAIRRGSAPRKSPAPLPLSATRVVKHIPLPTELLTRMYPNGRAETLRRQAQQELWARKAKESTRRATAVLGEIPATLRKSPLTRTEQMKMYVKPEIPGFAAPPDVVDPLPPCRFRRVTILECLRQVCVDQKAHIPVRGNWSAALPTPLDIPFSATVIGDYPYFNLGDTVFTINGYSSSGGWIGVHGTVAMTAPAKVKEIGLDFQGFLWAIVDGYDGFWSDDTGYVAIWSSYVVRTQPPGGPISYLALAGYNLEYRRLSNSYSVEHVGLSRHVVGLDIEAVAGQTFSVDYTIHWDIARTPGDDSLGAAAFGATVWSPQPYIIYESCHDEYKEIARFYQEAARAVRSRR